MVIKTCSRTGELFQSNLILLNIRNLGGGAYKNTDRELSLHNYSLPVSLRFLVAISEIFQVEPGELSIKLFCMPVSGRVVNFRITIVPANLSS